MRYLSEVLIAIMLVVFLTLLISIFPKIDDAIVRRIQETADVKYLIDEINSQDIRIKKLEQQINKLNNSQWRLK